MGGPGSRQVLGNPFVGPDIRTYGPRDKQYWGDNLQVPIFEGKLNYSDDIALGGMTVN
jgi:hypothetical protein